MLPTTPAKSSIFQLLLSASVISVEFGKVKLDQTCDAEKFAKFWHCLPQVNLKVQDIHGRYFLKKLVDICVCSSAKEKNLEIIISLPELTLLPVYTFSTKEHNRTMFYMIQ